MVQSLAMVIYKLCNRIQIKARKAKGAALLVHSDICESDDNARGFFGFDTIDKSSQARLDSLKLFNGLAQIILRLFR